MPSIRPATEADAEAILDLHVASIRELGSASYDDGQVEAWAKKPLGAAPYREAVRDGNTHIAVAEDGGELAGFGRVALDEGTVDAVYVHPDHARAGVGSALLSHLESRGRREGLDSLTLCASLNAVPFYAARGYEQVGTTIHQATGGVEMTCVEMRRDL